MRTSRLALIGLLSLAALGAETAASQAQDSYVIRSTRGGQGLAIRVRPRSWLDAGNVVEANSGAVSNPATNPHFITASYLASPPYIANRERFGGFGVLPDPITNGPFIGARRAAVTVDLSGLDYLDPTSPRARGY
ncbi:conserved hypothetical protein [Methylobacterium sp. 4-46]|uniref:hypothetical protein n=1 Tax=unclassified Methylobacterium TaxID=2615210 RepID=UPI000152C3D2|nr:MULTISPECIES: hypothetical protein [Methylobacterium]ACA17589.1 conserved hypothetical protein [Methylobacterium sp. 4-46]WFT83265.1 hypothetical protein QA634_16140 [Methylobacterium nodulans]